MKRPFLYFPLRLHFEHNFHVRHRLERYGAGRRMDYEDSRPERIAEAMAQEIGREVAYRDVEIGGAATSSPAHRRAALASPTARDRRVQRSLWFLPPLGPQLIVLVSSDMVDNLSCRERGCEWLI
jgi:hypothetical protein